MTVETLSPYGEVWAALYHLEPGGRTSARLLADELHLPEHRTAWRALIQAEEAWLVKLHSRKGRGGSTIWERAVLPEPLTTEWAVSRGARWSVALRVYTTLADARYLTLTEDGFIPLK